MHNPFDQMAKRVAREALAASGVVLVEHEISRDAQRADIFHEPDPTRGAERARLGLLGRMAEVLCLIEVFGHPPSAGEIRACLGKHIAHWERRERLARAHHRRRRARASPPEPEPVGPFLWILAATVSAPLLRKLAVEPAPGWPDGVYFFGAEALRVGVVVASELPRERSTLLVRLMAAGPGLPEAIAELAALPPSAPERAAATEIVVKLRYELERKANRTAEEEEIMVRMRDTWEDARKAGIAEGRTVGRAEGRTEGRAEGRTEGRAEGRTEGRAEGRAEEAAHAVLTVFEVRGLAVSEADRARILAERDRRRLERWLERAILAASVAEALGERR